MFILSEISLQYLSEWLAGGKWGTFVDVKQRIVCYLLLKCLYHCSVELRIEVNPQAIPWSLQLISGSHGAFSWCHHGRQNRMMQAGAKLQHSEWHSLTSGQGDFCPCTWSKPPLLKGKGKKIKKLALVSVWEERFQCLDAENGLSLQPTCPNNLHLQNQGHSAKDQRRVCCRFH